MACRVTREEIKRFKSESTHSWQSYTMFVFVLFYLHILKSISLSHPPPILNNIFKPYAFICTSFMFIWAYGPAVRAKPLTKLFPSSYEICPLRSFMNFNFKIRGFCLCFYSRNFCSILFWLNPARLTTSFHYPVYMQIRNLKIN